MFSLITIIIGYEYSTNNSGGVACWPTFCNAQGQAGVTIGGYVCRLDCTNLSDLVFILRSDLISFAPRLVVRCLLLSQMLSSMSIAHHPLCSVGTFPLLIDPINSSWWAVKEFFCAICFNCKVISTRSSRISFLDGPTRESALKPCRLSFSVNTTDGKRQL